jgi:WD40 repeat protein
MVVSAQSGISSAYSLEGLEKLFQLDVGGSGQIEQLDYSPDGTTIATCRFAGPFQVWDADSGTELFRLDDVTEGGCSFDYHPDSSSVFLGFLKNGTGWHQELALPKFEPDILIEASPLRSYDWLSPHEGASISIAFDEQTPSLAVVSAEGELFIWDPDVPYGGTEVRGSQFDSDPNSNAALLMREDRGYLDVLFDPIHDYMIVIGIDGSITIIDSQRLRIVKLIDAHEGQITAAVLSLDGSMLATSGLDRIINLWNTDTGDLLLSLVSQKAVITDLEFTPDGTRLFAAGADGTIRPYVLDVDELMTMAQSHVSRSLTNEECRQYLHMDACPIP